jgi:hypothetical protein
MAHGREHFRDRQRLRIGGNESSPQRSCAASTTSIAADRFSSASSERRALRLPSGSGKG